MSFGKRGQVAIFVIIAIVIIAAILVFLLVPEVRIIGSDDAPSTPEAYFSSCLEPVVRPALEKLANQGGYSQPLGFIVYNDSKVPYLCYTSEYYQTCVVQQPDIQGQFEKELNSALQIEAQDCAESFKRDFERRGYSVTISNVKVNSSFNLDKLDIEIQAPMTVTKESSRTYQKVDISVQTKMYELLALSTDIVSYESTYGDSETTLYMRYYPDIKIEKVKLSDGTKIYTISNVVSNDRFQFASRSLAWPAGYGLE